MYAQTKFELADITGQIFKGLTLTAQLIGIATLVFFATVAVVTLFAFTMTFSFPATMNLDLSWVVSELLNIGRYFGEGFVNASISGA